MENPYASPPPPRRSLLRYLREEFPKKWPFVAGALAGIAVRLIFSAGPGDVSPYKPMMSSFILLAPMLVGVVTVYLAERTERRSWRYYFSAAAVANVLFVLGAMIILIEGIICSIVVLPLFVVVGGLAGMLTGAICRWTRWPKHTVYCAAAMPLVFGAVEQHVALPSDYVAAERSIVVQATPAQIWPHLLSASHIDAGEMNEGWMYRIGVPLPLSAQTEEVDGKLVRHIRMGKSVHFDQVAEEWEPERFVHWVHHFQPDSFPPGALDDHVRIGGQFFDVRHADYSLHPAPGGTELRVRMTYRVSTHFNWYAKPIADFLIGNFEQTALEFYARRAEADRQARPFFGRKPYQVGPAPRRHSPRRIEAKA